MRFLREINISLAGRAAFWLFGILALFSCEKERPVHEERMAPQSHFVLMEASDQDWPENSLISVFSNSLNRPYILSRKEGRPLFEEVSSPRPVRGLEVAAPCAVFPYQEGMTISREGIVSLMLPSERNFVDLAYPPRAALLSAGDSLMSFQETCGYLLFQLTGQPDAVLNRVRIISCNGEPLSGTATLRFVSGTPVLSMAAQDAGEITVYQEGGVRFPSDGSPLILSIPVPQGVLSQGVTVEFENSEGFRMETSFDGPLDIRRGEALALTASLSKPRFRSFSLDGEEAWVLCKTGVSVILPVGTDVSRMTASFTTDVCDVYVGNEKQTAGVSVQDFTKPVTYRLVPLFGSPVECTVSACRFDLPALSIITQDEAPIISRVDWQKGATVMLRHTEGTLEDLGTTQIRGRGNSTWSYPKKAYAVKLDKKQALLGMPKDKRWNLLANWMDRTNMRNDIAFALARKTRSLEWTPRGRFVEVILNGEHKGNYYLCEHIKLAESRVNITEMTSEDVSGPAVTGGYIFELDSWFDEVNKFRTDALNMPVMIKEPDEDVLVPEQMAYVQDYFNTVESILTHLDSTTEDFRDYLDVDTYIDWWFVHELTRNAEPRQPKSVYMYKDREGKLKAGPCWDFDWGTFIPATSWWNTISVWYPYLFRDASFRKRVQEKWTETKADFEEVLPYIDEVAASLRNSDTMDSILWPITGSDANGDEDLDFDTAVSHLRENLANRISWMNRRIQNGSF